MRILQVHNHYRFAGGEDRVVAIEGLLLRHRNHDVISFTRDNSSLSGLKLLHMPWGAIWNQSVYREVRSIIRSTRPDVIHCHNLFPLLSPSVYYAANDEGVAVVQTLHNYRLTCANGLLFRNGGPCEQCVGRRLGWPGVIHACYRDGYAASAIATSVAAVHRAIATWESRIDRYIALTEFARRIFIQGGLPAEAISVKPNVVYPDPTPGLGNGAYALYVGRLSPEKGIDTLIDAWRKVGSIIPLKIVGDGPMAADVRRATSEIPGISWLGPRTPVEVNALMMSATTLVVPSVWYETFGLVVAEAFAHGTPVVASAVGALSELVKHGHNGLQFAPGDADALADCMKWVVANPQTLVTMRCSAREAYQTLYSADVNYGALIGIYEQALASARTAGRRSSGPSGALNG